MQRGIRPHRVVGRRPSTGIPLGRGTHPAIGPRETRVDLFADCMNKKQAARKEAARQKKAEEVAKRRQQRTERFETASQAHREANEQRIAQENAARTKRDDCKKQAKEQNLHLMKRLNFIKGCMEKK